MTHTTAIKTAHAATPHHAALEAHQGGHATPLLTPRPITPPTTPANTPLTTPATTLPVASTDTERRLIALIASELVLPAQTIRADTPIAHLGDSLDWLELLMAVEDAFGVELEPAQTKSITTVADLLRLLPLQAGESLQGEVQASVQQALLTMAAPRPA